ncbi:MAG: glycoside hydrolase family 127 protein, partial [Erysipelothrix sp.]|nr:glycoside hydrolase family 127 protein [Erysipelothrix sp.]
MENQGFWEKYKKLIKDVVLDYQYLVMLDEADIKIEAEREDASLPSERSQAITNLKIAAGLMVGEHYGWWFQDTDVYKWIETAAYTLENFDDEALKTRVDSVIDIIEQAQDEDGYLSTYYQLRAPHLKYKELDRSHELYNAGHLIEAAVAYAKATGNETLLEVSKRYVNHIMAHFGVGKIEGADGHQEIELALIKLYKYTNDEKYLNLSRYFIDVRGKDPLFYNKQKEALGQDPFTNLDYLQAYDQPIHQKEAKGHAVRMLYMMEAMADLALHQNDQAMEDAVMTLWDDIVKRKMYVTGGVGQTVHGESFADGY